MPVQGQRRLVIDRLMEEVEITNDCWLWTGARDRKGYGRIGAGGRRGRTLGVHVVIYEYLRGPVPDGLELDHLCRVRHCVRPSHLEAVTHAENIRRSRRWEGHVKAPKRKGLSNLCHEGQDLTIQANVYTSPQGVRRCRICKRANQARWKARRGQQSKD